MPRVAVIRSKRSARWITLIGFSAIIALTPVLIGAKAKHVARPKPKHAASASRTAQLIRLEIVRGTQGGCLVVTDHIHPGPPHHTHRGDAVIWETKLPGPIMLHFGSTPFKNNEKDFKVSDKHSDGAMISQGAGYGPFTYTISPQPSGCETTFPGPGIIVDDGKRAKH